jgi:hypothetical protein
VFRICTWLDGSAVHIKVFSLRHNRYLNLQDFSAFTLEDIRNEKNRMALTIILKVKDSLLG